MGQSAVANETFSKTLREIGIMANNFQNGPGGRLIKAQANNESMPGIMLPEVEITAPANSKNVDFGYMRPTISPLNQQQFMNVATGRDPGFQGQATMEQLREKMRGYKPEQIKASGRLGGYNPVNPIVFGREPGSAGAMLGKVLTLGGEPMPGQGYSFSPTETLKGAAFDFVTGEGIGRGLKAASPYVKAAFNKINPFKRGIPVSNQATRASFGRKLQEAGLLKPETNVELLSQYPNLEDNVTKAALKRFNTTYRTVNTDVEGMADKMHLNDMFSMAEKNIDITDPKQVAEYMATHVPHGQYSNRASMAQAGFDQDMINTARAESMEDAMKLARMYGDEGVSQHLVAVRPKGMNFAEGSKEDWLNKYFTNKPFAIKGMEANQALRIPQTDQWASGTIATRFDPSNPRQYWPYIGFRGEQLLDPIRSVKIK